MDETSPRLPSSHLSEEPIRESQVQTYSAPPKEQGVLLASQPKGNSGCNLGIRNGPNTVKNWCAGQLYGQFDPSLLSSAHALVEARVSVDPNGFPTAVGLSSTVATPADLFYVRQAIFEACPLRPSSGVTFKGCDTTVEFSQKQAEKYGIASLPELKSKDPAVVRFHFIPPAATTSASLISLEQFHAEGNVVAVPIRRLDENLLGQFRTDWQSLLISGINTSDQFLQFVREMHQRYGNFENGGGTSKTEPTIIRSDCQMTARSRIEEDQHCIESILKDFEYGRLSSAKFSATFAVDVSATGYPRIRKLSALADTASDDFYCEQAIWEKAPLSGEVRGTTIVVPFSASSRISSRDTEAAENFVIMHLIPASGADRYPDVISASTVEAPGNMVRVPLARLQGPLLATYRELWAKFFQVNVRMTPDKLKSQVEFMRDLFYQKLFL